MEEHLHILWTNADPVVFDKMVLMYAVNSLTHGWWEKVTVILWGESARLAVEDPAVAGRIRQARAQGVAFSASFPAPASSGWRSSCGRWDWRSSPGANR